MTLVPFQQMRGDEMRMSHKNLNKLAEKEGIKWPHTSLGVKDKKRIILEKYADKEKELVAAYVRIHGGKK